MFVDPGAGFGVVLLESPAGRGEKGMQTSNCSTVRRTVYLGGCACGWAGCSVVWSSGSGAGTSVSNLITASAEYIL